MKSRYLPLVALKKKTLDKAEQALLRANTEVLQAQEALQIAYEELSHITSPSSGSAGEFTQAQIILQAQHREIELTRQRVDKALSDQIRMRNSFNEALVDYEKFNYLELQEINQHIAKIKKEEAKMLDEIGTMTYKKEIV